MGGICWFTFVLVGSEDKDGSMAAILTEWIVGGKMKGGGASGGEKKRVQKAEMVTASWQSCKAELDSRDSPDFEVGLASEYTDRWVVAVTIPVALELSEAG